jgi:hypothetical protein
MQKCQKGEWMQEQTAQSRPATTKEQPDMLGPSAGNFKVGRVEFRAVAQ